MNEEVKLYFNSALEALEDFEIAINNEKYKMDVNRSYYATFYAANALLIKKGIITKTHRGTIQQFGFEYVLKGNFDKNISKNLSKLEDEREDVDYDIRFVLTEEAINALDDAKLFVDECRQFL
jgi:uncharacterized protein (UPF0332 family)